MPVPLTAHYQCRSPKLNVSGVVAQATQNQELVIGQDRRNNVRDVEGQTASRPMSIKHSSSSWAKMGSPDVTSRMLRAFSPWDAVVQRVDGYSVASAGLATLAIASFFSFERSQFSDGPIRERPQATQRYSCEIESQIGLTMPTSPEDDLTPWPSDSRCSMTNSGYMPNS